MRILFLDFERSGGTRTFDFDDAENLRGGERGLLYLAEALARRGHAVTIASLSGEGRKTQNAVTFVSLSTARSERYDVAISNNYAFAFDGITSRGKVVWTRNPGFSASHVKADFLGKLRHWPHIVHLSRYTRARSWFLPRSSSAVIHHGVPSELLAHRIPRPPPLQLTAIFSSYAGRNLSLAVKAWRDVVRHRVPTATLDITAEVQPKHVLNLSAEELAESNIRVLGTLPWSALMTRMKQCRVLLVPGHFQETYNNLVVEAAAAGLPTVTLGIGALGERVLHDRTGWVASSVKDMGQAIARILTDDPLWTRYHLACLDHPDLVTWDERSETWEKYFRNILAAGTTAA